MRARDPDAAAGALGGIHARAALDPRRRLQLGLAGLWLFDAVLQCQAPMFGPAFARMVGAAAQGNPAPVADSVTWTAHLIGQHPGVLNGAFAAVQAALALGIAWRPTVKPALAASAAWAVAVWWLGEGLGGVLTPTANPVTGAPGAVIMYALLAVVLWPASGDRPARPSAQSAARSCAARSVGARSCAARSVGERPAAAMWAALWGGLAWLAAAGAGQAPVVLPDQVAAMASGQPRWLAAVDAGAAGVFGRWGTPICLALAVACAIIAVAVAWPARRAWPARVALALAVVLALAAWVVGQDFGGLLTGMSTDPNSGPTLALLALAYWPEGATASAAATPAAPPAAGTPAAWSLAAVAAPPNGLLRGRWRPT